MKAPEGCGCGAPPLAELTEQLRRGSRKITGPRQAILAVLRRRRSPLTHKQLHAALGADACDLATVYRNLRTLEELGLVQRCDFGDGSARFELNPGGPSQHHHHLVCRGCARIVELQECLPPGLEAGIAQRHGFADVTHHLEFFGLCADCRQPPAV